MPVINLAPYLKRGETVPDPSSLAPIFPFDPQNDPPTGFPLIHRITSVQSVRVDETFTRFVPFIYFLFCLYGIDPRLGIMDNAGYPCSKSFRVTKVATDGHRVTMNPKSGTDLSTLLLLIPAIFSIQDRACRDILLLAYTEHWHTEQRMGFDVGSEIATVTRSQWFTGYQIPFALRSTVRIKLSLVLINAFPYIYIFLYSWNT